MVKIEQHFPSYWNEISEEDIKFEKETFIEKLHWINELNEKFICLDSIMR